MNQLIITVVYDSETGEVGVNVSKLGANKSVVNIRDLLTALHAAEGQYIAALEVAQLPEEEDVAN